MEYLEDDPQTPRFRNYQTSIIESQELFVKRIQNSIKDVIKYIDNKEYNKKEKRKSKTKSRNKERSKYNNKEKSKSKSKGKSKNKHEFSKSNKKNISGLSLPVEQKYENPFDIFLKKRIELRNDFDQNNSEKFLSDKELAFLQFKIDENADNLDN